MPGIRTSALRLVDLPLVALVVTLVVELFNHKAFTDGLESFAAFATEHPLALVTDFLIVLATLTPAVFLRRRVFYTSLVAILWLIGGAANGFILLNRMTALYHGGPDRPQQRIGYPAQLPLDGVYRAVGGCGGCDGSDIGPAVLEGPPKPRFPAGSAFTAVFWPC